MKNRWSEEEARGLSKLDLLVYQSRLVGADSDLVIWGGGNTSLKVAVTDFRGRETEGLFIKASGSDMKSSQRKDFPGLSLDDILPLLDRAEMTDDEMVDYLAHCLLEPGSARPSIETLLHAFLPHASIVHSHADAILAMTNTHNPGKLLDQVYGGDVVVLQYQRPGFLLSKAVAEAVLKEPDVKGAVLLNHGLVTWGATPKTSYDIHLDLVTKAEEFIRKQGSGKVRFGGADSLPLSSGERRRVAAAVTPSLRSALCSSGGERVLMQFNDDVDILDFVCSRHATKLAGRGAVTPDHLLHTKHTPVLVEVADVTNIDYLRLALGNAVDGYRTDYSKWFNVHARDTVEMLDPNPRVVMVPRVGMWVTGRDAMSLKAASEAYHHTINVMKGAQSVGEYTSLSPRDAFEAEYWPQELYKLTLALPEKDMARKVALITGAAGGIGRAIALKLADEGAHVVITDINLERAQAVTQEINVNVGAGRAVAFSMDVASESDVDKVFDEACLSFGGLDILVSNAGVAQVGALHELPLADWQQALAINATGHFLVARKAVNLMRRQGLGGNLVFVATKNVTAPGKDFGAYSASKAAEAQLARVLAIENGEHKIRCNIVNPDAIFQGSGLWSQEVREQRAQAHGISVAGLESYYQQRNLLKQNILAEDVAEAVLFLASEHSSKITGAMIPVDGGLREAFPR